jgi:uncharacterized delta-60 repeat protein
MRKVFLLCGMALALVGLVTLPGQALAKDGTLDPTFGDAGLVTTDFGYSNPDVDPAVAAIQADGKIVAAGYTNASGGYDFALARYNPDGTLDPTFGTAGLVTTDFGGTGDTAYAVAIQADGKIVAGGWAIGDEYHLDFALARYEIAQTPDQALIDKAEELLESFNEAVADGYLVGTGNAKAAPGRLNAVRNKLIEAESFIAGGDYESALAILYDIYKLCDGNPKPPDLVEGSAAADLSDEVWALIEMIEEATS